MHFITLVFLILPCLLKPSHARRKETEYAQVIASDEATVHELYDATLQETDARPAPKGLIKKILHGTCGCNGNISQGKTWEVWRSFSGAFKSEWKRDCFASSAEAKAFFKSKWRNRLLVDDRGKRISTDGAGGISMSYLKEAWENDQSNCCPDVQCHNWRMIGGVTGSIIVLSIGIGLFWKFSSAGNMEKGTHIQIFFSHASAGQSRIARKNVEAMATVFMECGVHPRGIMYQYGEFEFHSGGVVEEQWRQHMANAHLAIVVMEEAYLQSPECVNEFLELEMLRRPLAIVIPEGQDPRGILECNLTRCALGAEKIKLSLSRMDKIYTEEPRKVAQQLFVRHFKTQ